MTHLQVGCNEDLFLLRFNYGSNDSASHTRARNATELNSAQQSVALSVAEQKIIATRQRKEAKYIQRPAETITMGIDFTDDWIGLQYRTD